MTLIVPFISEDFVALASDRRITWQVGGASTGWEDTENKAIVLAGHFLMGYSGFARLGGVKTEQWIVEKLVHVDDPTSYFSVLADESEPAVKAMRLPLERSGHVFAAAGFARDNADELHACGVTVSNALGSGGYGIWEPTDGFSTLKSALLSGPDDFFLNAFGMSPPRAVLNETIELIQRCREDSPGSTLGVVQLMVDLVRKVAAGCDGVSKGGFNRSSQHLVMEVVRDG